MMKIRKSIVSTKRNNSELKSIETSSCQHTKTYKMKANNMSSSSSSSLWRRVLSIGLLLQILVNCGKFNYILYYLLIFILIFIRSVTRTYSYSLTLCFCVWFPLYISFVKLFLLA